jgi:hypothetical protein
MLGVRSLQRKDAFFDSFQGKKMMMEMSENGKPKN